MDLSFCSKELDENTKMLEQKNAGMKIWYPDLPSPDRGPAPR